jgi:HEAT repeat protein
MKKRLLIPIGILALVALVAAVFMIDPLRTSVMAMFPHNRDVYKGKTKEQWIQGLKDPDEKARRRAYTDLIWIDENTGENPVHILIAALKNDDEVVRAKAAEGLSSLRAKGKEAIPDLTGALKDKSPDVRANSAEALTKMRPEAKTAMPNLIDLLDDDKPLVQRRAAEALAAFNQEAKGAVPKLVTLWKTTKDPKVKETAAQALWAIDKQVAEKEGVPQRAEIHRSAPPLQGG